MYHIHNVQQKSVEWLRLRLGRFTSSEVGKLMQSGKNSEFSQTALNYINQVAAERTIDTSFFETREEWEELFKELNGPQSYAMRRGSETEEFARKYYENATGRKVVEIGFITTSDNVGDSPDGLIYSKRGVPCKAVEIKCPTLKVHYEHCKLKTAEDLKKFNPIYYAQCQMHIKATKARSCDFISFDYRAKKKMHIINVKRDTAFIRQLSERIKQAEEYIKNN